MSCNLLLAHAAFAEYDAVGIGLGDALDCLLNLLELFTASWNQRIVKLNHNTFRFGILADSFNELLVDSRSLYHIHGTAIAHNREKIHGIHVIHYGNHGEFVTLTLLPVD